MPSWLFSGSGPPSLRRKSGNFWPLPRQAANHQVDSASYNLKQKGVAFETQSGRGGYKERREKKDDPGQSCLKKTFGQEETLQWLHWEGGHACCFF
jgi:hypothetical protein